MENLVRRTVVVSAVNIRKGGTLTILKECLAYLSQRKDLKVTAIVHSAELCLFDDIEYIEFPWTIKSWGHRLWCEYFTLRRLSEKIGKVDLWLSLHDTTPNVKALKQAVYCHTSFPFLKIRFRDFLMDVKIPLFAMFTKFAYKINVNRNAYLIVQQQWFRASLSKLIDFDKDRILVAPPITFYHDTCGNRFEPSALPLFIFPATADCHKNFEVLCEAGRLLESRVGPGRFKIVVTISGKENRYSKWLYGRWGNVKSIEFRGLIEHKSLLEYYNTCSCLVFPSRIETWGLPISEFMVTRKPMILADLPYSYETASGAGQVAFFKPDSAFELSKIMESFINGYLSDFKKVREYVGKNEYLYGWEALFEKLI